MKKKIIIILVLLIVLVSTFAFIDYRRVNNLKAPIFCIYKDVIRDGGSKVYYGLGYIIIDYYNPVTKENKVTFGVLHRPEDPFPLESRLLTPDTVE